MLKLSSHADFMKELLYSYKWPMWEHKILFSHREEPSTDLNILFSPYKGLAAMDVVSFS